MRFRLHLLLLAVPAFAVSSEPPVNLFQSPSLLGDADRSRLTSLGYRFDDGFIRRGAQAPLTKTRLDELLASLRGPGPRAQAAPAAAAPSDAVPVVAPGDSERVRVVIQRAGRAWSRGEGDDAWTPVAAHEVPSGHALKVVTVAAQDGTAVAKHAPLALAALGGGGARHASAERLPLPFRLVPIRTAALEAGAQAALGKPAQGKPQGPGRTAPAPGRASPPAPVVPPAPGPLPPQNPNPRAPEGRLASVFLSEDLINEVVGDVVQTEAVRNLTVSFQTSKQRILVRGTLKVPADVLRRYNLEDAKVPDFKFVMTVEAKTTKEGYLILVFPMQETTFWRADSKDPAVDRVVVPVQFVELALASVRGYLGVLSGDYSSFDRRAASIRQKKADVDRRVAAAKDSEVKAELMDESASLDLEQQALPIERRRAERAAKKFGSVLGFVGEKEIRLNDQLSADANTIIVKLKLEKIAPFLKGAQLGGVRLLVDTRDGSGAPFLAIDLVKAPAP
ncbi:MAG: hypothetical protein HY553_05770 [Elusimicrobia bacterium]|nr:hypothetical protein [Elusimicrobiota bacterium]